VILALMFQALTDADPKALEELGEWLRQVFNDLPELPSKSLSFRLGQK
jgi:hypothetical protein